MARENHWQSTTPISANQLHLKFTLVPVTGNSESSLHVSILKEPNHIEFRGSVPSSKADFSFSMLHSTQAWPNTKLPNVWRSLGLAECVWIQCNTPGISWNAVGEGIRICFEDRTRHYIFYAWSLLSQVFFVNCILCTQCQLHTVRAHQLCTVLFIGCDTFRFWGNITKYMKSCFQSNAWIFPVN